MRSRLALATRLALLTSILSLALACAPPAPPAAPTAPPTPQAAAPAPAAPEAPAVEPIALDIRDAAGAQLSGNPATGQRIFRALCASCHAITAGLNGTGPSLHGVVGRPAGTLAGFNYSAANRDSGITWTEQELFAYLERPMAVIPGTTMSFAGISRPQQRADLIAYLSQNGD